MAIHKRLFLLLIFFLPTQLGFHFWPLWASILGRRIDYLAPTLYLTDILIVGILGFWAYERIALTRTSRVVLKKYVVLSLLASLVFIGINSALATNSFVALYKWAKLLEFVGLGWYIISTNIHIVDIVLPLSLSIGYSSLIACFQFFLQHSLGGAAWYMGERTFSLDTPGIARFNMCPTFLNFCKLVLRPYATFPHPNVLGGYLATTIPLVIYHLFTNHETHKRTIFYRCMVCIGLVTLLLSLSRSAWMVTCINIGVIIYIMRHAPIKKLGNTHLLGIIPFLFAFAGFTFIPSFSDESVVRRVELQNSAIHMWQHAPIFGVGLGNFLVELPTYTLTRQGNFLQPVHNIYLLIFSELGIVGSLGVLVIMGVFTRYVWKKIFRIIKTHRRVEIVYMLPFFTLLLLGIVDHYPLTLQQGQLLFVLIIVLQISSHL